MDRNWYTSLRGRGLPGSPSRRLAAACSDLFDKPPDRRRGEYREYACAGGPALHKNLDRLWPHAYEYPPAPEPRGCGDRISIRHLGLRRWWILESVAQLRSKK